MRISKPGGRSIAGRTTRLPPPPGPAGPPLGRPWPPRADRLLLAAAASSAGFRDVLRVLCASVALVDDEDEGPDLLLLLLLVCGPTTLPPLVMLLLLLWLSNAPPPPLWPFTIDVVVVGLCVDEAVVAAAVTMAFCLTPGLVTGGMVLSIELPPFVK